MNELYSGVAPILKQSHDDQLYAKYGVRRHQSDAAYQIIRNAIISGRIEQGAQLSERSLGEEYGFSRTPVRHALTRLASDGLAEQVPHAGTFVRKLGMAEARELVGFRRGMESAAAAMAATRITASEIDELEKLASKISRLDELSDAGSGTDASWTNREAEFRFHRRVVELTENPEMIRVVNNAIWAFLTLCADVTEQFHIQAQLERQQVVHQDMVAVMASRNAHRAFGAMWDHFESLVEWMDMKVAEARDEATLVATEA